MKVVFLLFLCLNFLNVFSQNNKKYTLDFSEEVSVILSKNIADNNRLVNKYGNKNFSLSVFLEIPVDKDGEISEFSVNLADFCAPKISTKIEFHFRSSLGLFSDFLVVSENINNVNTELNYCNFSLKWNYLTNNDTVFFYNVVLISNFDTVKAIIPLSNFYVINERISPDFFEPIQFNYLTKFIKLNYNSSLLNSVLINDKTNNLELFPKNINKIFAYNNIDTLTEYYFNINLSESAYVYVFGYSQLDTNFLYLIYPFDERENIELSSGNSFICKDSPLIFGDLKQGEDRSYIKFIISKEKIDIFNFSQQVKMADEVYINILNQDQTRGFINLLQVKSQNNNINTYQIVFIYK